MAGEDWETDRPVSLNQALLYDADYGEGRCMKETKARREGDGFHVTPENHAAPKYALDQLPPCLGKYAIEGKNFAAGCSLSLEVEKAVREVVERVASEVEYILKLNKSQKVRRRVEYRIHPLLEEDNAFSQG